MYSIKVNNKRLKMVKLGYHSNTLYVSLSLSMILICTTILANDFVSKTITTILWYQEDHLNWKGSLAYSDLFGQKPNQLTIWLNSWVHKVVSAQVMTIIFGLPHYACIYKPKSYGFSYDTKLLSWYKK